MYTIEQRDEQLLGSTATVRYRLGFADAAQHRCSVVIEIDDPGKEIILALPSWIPGSYKIRDFISFQGDVAASDAEGNRLRFEWLAKNRLRVQTDSAAMLRLSYIFYGHERTVRMSHINRFHAFINPANMMMYVEGRRDVVHHVVLDHAWSRVSTALSPVRESTYGALNYDILIDSPIEIGDHYSALFRLFGSSHEVAITGVGDFDPDWIADRVVKIVEQAHAMWRELPYDRYVFIIQLVAGQYGGLEHARSSVNMYDAEVFNDRAKIVKLLVLLCHEYFHLWNVKRIRPVELGPFDYQNENYTRMLWLAEGVTTYYEGLMAYRCRFHSRQGYLKAISEEHISRLLDVPGRSAMSIKDASFLAWVKLYVPTPDSANRFPSYYLKGNVIFLLMDMYIITESNATRSLDDGMRALMQRYIADPSHGLSEEEFIEIVSHATGVDIGPQLLKWLDGTDELPVAEIVSNLGLDWRAVQPDSEPISIGDGDDAGHPSTPQRWSGMAVEERAGSVRISHVLRDSPAEHAGLASDDEIIAVDGTRVASLRSYEAIIRGARLRREVNIIAATEGRIYETTLAFVPRIKFELVEREEMSDAERLRLEYWLVRDKSDVE